MGHLIVFMKDWIFLFRCLFLCIGFLLGLSESPAAQVVAGRVSNEFNEPVPYANIFIQQLKTGTLADDEGRYVLPIDLEGEYNLVFSSLGYESQSAQVLVVEDTTWVYIKLLTAGLELDEITVNASQKDPAFAIIKKVIDGKEERQAAIQSFRSQVYVKAVENTALDLNTAPARAKKKAGKREKPGETQSSPVPDEGLPGQDPFAEEEARKRAEEEALLGNIQMIEMALTLHYQAPNTYKEERTAYQTYGKSSGLFVPVFSQTDFNFYRNMVPLPGISDAPIISPLSNNAILTYKYELLATRSEDGQLVYEIAIIPRKEGNSTVRGTIFINEGSYSINRLALQLPSATLRFADNFKLEQSYRQLHDSLWVVDRQAFYYTARADKEKTFEGTTLLQYSNYEHNIAFPANFFSNEVASTSKEAYERSSDYWAQSRTEALAEQEARMVQYRDSIQAVRNSPAYKDSIEALYNKVNLLEILWDGVGVRNYRKKKHVYIGPLASTIDFSPVGGWRLGPYASNFRRYASGRIWSTSGTVDVGLKNRDIQGNFSSWFRYDPFRMGDVAVSGGRSFESVNPFDAYLNLLRPSNYILRDALRLTQGIEIVNGLRFESRFEWSDRRPITGYSTSSFLSDVVVDEEGLLDFERYQAFISTNTLLFTPGQRYMREPDRKVILGSKWPTFSLEHQRGWRGAFGSDIRFDYLEVAMEQEIIFGALGNTRYRAQIGQFVNTQDLRFVDWKRFRQSDPFLYSDPLRSFQLLDTSLHTTNLHAELHFIHHFNGAIINNIPLLKKTRLKTVVGGGLLWLEDGNYRHQELFAGLERVFKVGARRRLRVGIFGVIADNNQNSPQTTWKIGFDLIDIWKRDWSF